MDGLMAFLGNARYLAGIYMGTIFIVATALFFFDRRPRRAASSHEDAHAHQSKAA